MNDFVLVFLVGLVMGIVGTLVFLFKLVYILDAEPPPDTREQVLAKVLLNRVRRKRQLAELEHDLDARLVERRRQLGDHDRRKRLG